MVALDKLMAWGTLRKPPVSFFQESPRKKRPVGENKWIKHYFTFT